MSVALLTVTFFILRRTILDEATRTASNPAALSYAYLLGMQWLLIGYLLLRTYYVHRDEVLSLSLFPMRKKKTTT